MIIIYFTSVLPEIPSSLAASLRLSFCHGALIKDQLVLVLKRRL